MSTIHPKLLCVIGDFCTQKSIRPFYDFNKRASVYTFNKNRHTADGENTHNGDSDHHFQARSSQLLSLKKKKKKKTQKSDSLVRVSRQRLQVPCYLTEINSTSETKARFNVVLLPCRAKLIELNSTLTRQ